MKILFLVLFLLLFLIVIYVCLHHRRSERYGGTPYDGYDYDQENPNALICGKNIAGTVYSADVENTPGLGWVL